MLIFWSSFKDPFSTSNSLPCINNFSKSIFSLDCWYIKSSNDKKLHLIFLLISKKLSFLHLFKDSKFGKYTGNGDADGAFVYTGFRPAFFLHKRINTAEDWHNIDSVRNPNNKTQNILFSKSIIILCNDYTF